MMVRKHIFISKSLNAQIKQMAKIADKSESQIMREMIEKSAKPKKQNGGDFLRKLAGIGGRGPKDMSMNIDKYLYEDA